MALFLPATQDNELIITNNSLAWIRLWFVNESQGLLGVESLEPDRK